MSYLPWAIGALFIADAARGAIGVAQSAFGLGVLAAVVADELADTGQFSWITLYGLPPRRGWSRAFNADDELRLWMREQVGATQDTRVAFARARTAALAVAAARAYYYSDKSDPSVAYMEEAMGCGVIGEVLRVARMPDTPIALTDSDRATLYSLCKVRV